MVQVKTTDEGVLMWKKTRIKGRRRKSKMEGSIGGSSSSNITGWPLSRSEQTWFTDKTAAFLSCCWLAACSPRFPAHAAQKNRAERRRFNTSQGLKEGRKWVTGRLKGKWVVSLTYAGKRNMRRRSCQFIVICRHLVANEGTDTQFSSASFMRVCCCCSS